MLVVSCSKPLDIQLEPEVHMFISNDSEKKIRLTQEDEAYVFLNTWLHENKANWFPTSGRYPDGVYIKSGAYGIQITELKVIIYTTLGSEPQAIYIQDINKGELNKIVDVEK
tara:strand:+ start:406 stop:741 length:336 start_codon:yes stop_codon:yes gene_type:complete